MKRNLSWHGSYFVSVPKWVLPEPLADKARQLRDDYQNRIHELIAPDIFPVEVAHALARAERRNIIAVGQAPGLLANVMRTSPVLPPYLPLLARALDVASRMRCSVYDCLYVVLAEHEGCELVTADDRLVRNLRPHFPFIVPLSSLMTRVEEVRIQLKRLVDAVPFRPFIITLENGVQVEVEHPENIAYSFAPYRNGKVRQAFYVLTADGLVESNLGAITNLFTANGAELAG